MLIPYVDADDQVFSLVDSSCERVTQVPSAGQKQNKKGPAGDAALWEEGRETSDCRFNIYRVMRFSAGLHDFLFKVVSYIESRAV